MNSTTNVNNYPFVNAIVPQPPPKIGPKDTVSLIPLDLQKFIAQFVDDSERHISLCFVSRTWRSVNQKLAHERILKVATMLRQKPVKIFYFIDNKSKELGSRWEVYKNDSCIMHASKECLAISNGEGVFTTTDRSNWKRLAQTKGYQQNENRQGIISYATRNRRESLSVRLQDNVIINRQVEEGDLNVFKWLSLSDTERLVVNWSGRIFYCNCLNIPHKYSFFLEVNPSYKTRYGFNATNVVLQHKWLSVEFEIEGQKNQFRIYDIESKEVVLTVNNGDYFYTRDYLIMQDSKEIAVFTMTTSSPPKLDEPKWKLPIDKPNLQASDNNWLVFNKKTNDKDYTILNMHTGKVQGTFIKPENWKTIDSITLHRDLLFMNYNNEINVIHIPTGMMLIENKIIPGFCSLLDAKIIGDEVLVYYSTSDYMHRVIQFKLNGEIPISEEELKMSIEMEEEQEKKSESELKMHIEDAPPIPLAPAAVFAPGIEDNAQQGILVRFFLGAWSIINSCFESLGRFFLRLFHRLFS